MAVEKVRPIDRFLEIVYSFAAVPVLLGALFKITHTAPFGSANGWLNFGLYTEAFVFTSFGLLYIFAPPKAVDEMGLPIGDLKNGKTAAVAAQPSALAAVDNMLKDADITPESMNRLSDGFKNLEASIESYKKALRIDPTDQQARENLQKALLEQKKQQQQQQQQKPQSSMSQNEAERKLRQLQQRERELQQRMRSRKQGAGQAQDW